MTVKKNTLLVVLGVTDDRKARAARFDIKDEAIVRKAAAAMNLRAGFAKSDQAILLASKLPEGKLFQSGVGLVPLVRSEVFYKMAELLTFDSTWTELGVLSGRGTSASPELLKATDTVWSAVKVGSTVLAWDFIEPSEFGWGAAVILAISKDGETLDLRWRDWPETKAFKAKRHTVGLFRPDVAP